MTSSHTYNLDETGVTPHRNSNGWYFRKRIVRSTQDDASQFRVPHILDVNHITLMAVICADDTASEIPLFVLKGTHIPHRMIVKYNRYEMETVHACVLDGVLLVRMLHLFTELILQSRLAVSFRKSNWIPSLAWRSLLSTVRTVHIKLCKPIVSYEMVMSSRIVSPPILLENPNSLMCISLAPSKIGWTERCNVQTRFTTRFYSTSVISFTWWRMRTLQQSHPIIFFLNSAKLVCRIQ